jgi:hypothetical protein
MEFYILWEEGHIKVLHKMALLTRSKGLLLLFLANP